MSSRVFAPRQTEVKPLVRVVICAHNGRDLTERCLESLAKLDWPTERLDVVVVDNASSDGTAERIHDRYPRVRVLRPSHNLGFAGGNNLGMAHLAGVDYVALLNNDVVVDPDWLAPLVETLEADGSLGAACPKVLFDAMFFDVELRAEPGVRVCGVDVPHEGRLPGPQYVRGFHDPELDAQDRVFRRSEPSATIRIPVPRNGDAPDTFRIALAGEEDSEVMVTVTEQQLDLVVSREATWFDVPVRGPFYEVVNNAGSVLFEGGHGGDRGYCERDQGQFDEGAEVFAWCGCSVLLSTAYLRDIGLFDERFFLYYEDLDLSWRGQARGWRYAYVPRSVARHIHAASTVEHSPLFQRYVERNRLLMLLRNAPTDLCRGAVVDYLRVVWSDLGASISEGRAGRPVRLRTVVRRLRVLAELAWFTPGTLRSRAQTRARQSVPDNHLLAWAVHR